MSESTKLINDYVTEKRNIPLVPIVPNPRITHSMIKSAETEYNPITQTYREAHKEHALTSYSSREEVLRAAQNKDRALRYEQTFNFINMRDKLKGFETHPDYPRYKSDYRMKKTETSKLNFNILSNISLDKHHFLPPNKRPVVAETTESLKPKVVNSVNFKDYNIINNRYKEFHEEKTNIDSITRKLQAGKNFWARNTYDCVKNKFLDPEKEEKARLHEIAVKNEHGRKAFHRLPPQMKASGGLYNPINNEVQNKDALSKFDKKSENAINRYAVGYLKEKEWKSRKEVTKQMKQRQELENLHGFDLVTHEEKPLMRHEKAGWSELGGKVKENQVFREAFDWSDNVRNRHNFYKERSGLLKELPDIKSDKVFEMKPVIKSRLQTEDREKISSVSVDKENFFRKERVNRSEEKNRWCVESFSNDRKERINFKNLSKIPNLSDI